MADENFNDVSHPSADPASETQKNPPRFRQKSYKMKDGSVHTYFTWDGRPSDRKDVRLGKDRDVAIKLWEQCELGNFPNESKKKSILGHRVDAASVFVQKRSSRKKQTRDEKNDIWASSPDWVRRLYYSAQTRAKKRNKAFSISPFDMVQLVNRADGKCEISSIPFESSGPRSPFSISLDRIDSSKGYEKGNVRLVCLLANLALNKWGIEPVETFARAIMSASAQPYEPTHEPTHEPTLQVK